VPRGDVMAAAVRELYPDGVDAVIDAALLGPAILPAVRDGGQLLAVRPYQGPAENGKAERDITVQVVMVGRHLHEGYLIAELAEKNRLPAMCPYRDYVEAGGLMAYAVDLAELLRRMADDVHQILKGSKPGDIPIYQPTRFELLINLKTAKALGLTLPPALLALAAETIQ